MFLYTPLQVWSKVSRMPDAEIQKEKKNNITNKKEELRIKKAKFKNKIKDLNCDEDNLINKIFWNSR